MKDQSLPQGTQMPTAAPVPRKMPRDARREQLIEATIEVMAEQGFARITLADVARKAGLAHGLVNFHFQTKDALLAETLSYLSQEYRANWRAALDQATPTPAARLNALIRAAFVPAICTPAPPRRPPPPPPPPRPAPPPAAAASSPPPPPPPPPPRGGAAWGGGGGGGGCR